MSASATPSRISHWQAGPRGRRHLTQSGDIR